MLRLKYSLHVCIICLFTFTSTAQAKIPTNILKDLKVTNTIENKIIIHAPDIAENGAVVPVSIEHVVLDDSNVFVTAVYIFSDIRKDPISQFKLGKSMLADGLATRIKLSRSSIVYVLAVLSNGQVLSAEKLIKVTIGGCGGGGTISSGASPQSYTGPYLSSATSVMHSGSDNEKYAKYDPNPIKLVSEHPVSTFSIDVDSGSYSNVRRFIVKEGRLPVVEAVRTEELINYFSYQYPTPVDRTTPFTLNTEIAATPWNPDTRLLHIGLKGYEVDSGSLPPANLVFLVDVSGSMHHPSKLGLLKASLRMLTRKMRSIDHVSIVVYAGASGVVLPPTSGTERSKILAALDVLSAGGSTNGAAGIHLAYAVAHQAFIPGGINRIILATDGDFNVGTVNHDALIKLIKKQRKSGISITALGFGRGNYNEYLMEQIADNGDGNYAYIDSLQEARKALVEEMSSTLFTIAKDVKIQVEFNPALVAEYRLIGFENRLLKREDFNDDKVDAGDIGAGHTMTAIYELTMQGAKGKRIDALRYRQPAAIDNFTDELAQIKLRYKSKQGGHSKLISRVIRSSDITPSLQQTSDDYRFSAAVAAYGQLLKGGKYLEGFGYAQIGRLAASAIGDDRHGNRQDFVRLVNLTESLQPLKEGLTGTNMAKDEQG